MHLINIDEKFFDDAFAELSLLPQYKKNTHKGANRDPIQCEGKEAHTNGTCTYWNACKDNMKRIYSNTKQSIAFCKILTTKDHRSAEDVYDIFSIGNLYVCLLEK